MNVNTATLGIIVFANGDRKKQRVSEDGDVRAYGWIENIMSEAI